MARTCGECSLCCKLLDIFELAKPRNVWCPHVLLKRGCTLYEDRPQSCRNFHCLWLTDSRLGEEWKPTKSKFIVTAEGPSQVVVYVDAGARQPWMREPFFSVLREMSARGLAAGGILTVVENGETTVILPDRCERLGKLLPDQRIMMGEIPTPYGPRYDVRVLKADQVPEDEIGVGWIKPPRP